MLALVVVLLFGILFAVFATQNTTLTTITIANYELSGIPLYIVALGGLLLGVVISTILSFFDAIATFFTLHGKDSAISSHQRTINDLKRKIRDLELDNAKLRGERSNDSRLGALHRPRTIG